MSCCQFFDSLLLVFYCGTIDAIKLEIKTQT